MGSIGSLSRCVPSIEVTNTQPKISPDISQCHHAIPGKLKSEKEMQKFHTDDTPLANVLDWLCSLGNLFQPIKSTTLPYLGSDTSSL